MILELIQGDTCEFTATYSNDLGTAVDLTDYTALMQVREFTWSEEADVDLTDGSGITLGGVAGTVAVSFVVPDLTWRRGYWSLVLVDGDGKVTTLLKGSALYAGSVTRAAP